MAYYYPAKSPVSGPENPPRQQPAKSPVNDIKNTITAPFAGFWQGFSGKNMTYEQWLAYKKRSRKIPPRRNWLQRAIGI